MENCKEDKVVYIDWEYQYHSLKEDFEKEIRYLKVIIKLERNNE